MQSKWKRSMKNDWIFGKWRLISTTEAERLCNAHKRSSSSSALNNSNCSRHVLFDSHQHKSHIFTIPTFSRITKFEHRFDFYSINWRSAKMDADDWKGEMHHLMQMFQRESTNSLRKINRCFAASGRAFDEEFCKYFLKMSTLQWV